MNTKLIELNEAMGTDIYEMYQDIPDGDNGQTNKCYGLTYKEFKEFLKSEIKRKFNDVTYDDTPTITYIMYADDVPIGYICLRTQIDDNWKKWSGNFYYQIRKSNRRQGYGTQILSLGLKKLKELGFKEVLGQSSADNIGSVKVIENNDGIFIKEVNGTRYYKIILDSQVG